ncbi:MAG: ParA family protein [Candidatus Sedimenticola sp. (ex Thyasira tokunagai)]
MPVLVVANNKGGVGKTTISEIICIAGALGNKRVLGIDMDPQCNFSRRFLAMEVDPFDPEIIRPPVSDEHDPIAEPESDGRGSSADIFFKGTTISYPTAYSGLEIIPGHSKDLLNVERVTHDEVSKKVHQQLAGWMEDAEIDNEFDLVVIDTGPSKGPLTTSAMHSATHMMIPAEMEELSVEGLYGMLAYWSMQNLQRVPGETLELIGILANKFDKRLPIHQHYYDSLKSSDRIGPLLFPEKMHYWQDYKESSMADGTPVLKLPPSNKTRKEAEAICGEILKRIFSHE